MHDDELDLQDQRRHLDIHQHLGRLEGRMDGMEQRQTRFEMRTDTTLNSILDEVRSLGGLRAQAAGGWKVLVSGAAVLVFLSGIATWGITEVLDQTRSQITDESIQTVIDHIDDQSETENAKE